MPQTDIRVAAGQFRDLNAAGRLLLPNAWDAASARVFEAAGFAAVGTTSGGIAHARGYPDGETMTRDDMLREIAAIVRAVAVPVSADIEAGYGARPADVTATVDAVLDLGVAGINLEDRVHRSGGSPMFGVDEQVRRIDAARAAADRHGTPLVINARTDTFLANVGADLEDRLSITVQRGLAYLAAGADLVFVPGLIDPDGIRHVAQAVQSRVSVMVLPGAPPAEALFAAGARRVSLGNVAMLAAFGALRDAAADVKRTGSWGSLERTFFGFDEADALFARR